MALLLTQKDLRPLMADSKRLDDAFAAIEAGLREDLAGTVPRFPTHEAPVTGPQRSLRLNFGVSPTAGVSIRTYPMLERINPDSHVNLLFDSADGRLLAIIAGDELNMLRTAIPVGLAARYLAPSGARVLAMVGSGRQARGQAKTIRHALPTLERIQVFSPTSAHRAAYAAEMSAVLGLPVLPKATCYEALEGADVIALNASSRSPVLEAEWVKPGGLVLSINSAQLPPTLVQGARVVLGYGAERLGQPYAGMIEQGSWSMDRVEATVGEVLAGARPAREQENDIVLADMLGAGIWDVALLRWAYDWALAQEVGTAVHLSDR